MVKKRLPALVLAVALLLGAAVSVGAAEVDCDGVYCFSPGDFSAEPLAGICITGLPESTQGALMLGSRALRPGDVIPGNLLSKLTFVPTDTPADVTALVCYLPIYDDYVAPADAVTISIRRKQDAPPVAEDFALETYKNLPIQGRLKVKDPEGQAMTFTLVRGPKRGQVTINPDGSFTYTPKKNKVGIDSFVYTAADPAGNLSRETTVTITIVRPTDSTQYTDTIGESCRFAAEWMKNTGIFVGETLDGNPCFQPDRAVTRGEFTAMLVRTLEIPLTEGAVEEDESVPVWLRPYIAAAIRSGLTAGLPGGETGDLTAPITGPEAAVMLQNALDLRSGDLETLAGVDVPQWAASALAALEGGGIDLPRQAYLTRAQAALALYQASVLADWAPGMAVFRKVR